jgi:fumarate reductase subunit C
LGIVNLNLTALNDYLYHLSDFNAIKSKPFTILPKLTALRISGLKKLLIRLAFTVNDLTLHLNVKALTVRLMTVTFYRCARPHRAQILHVHAMQEHALHIYAEHTHTVHIHTANARARAHY